MSAAQIPGEIATNLAIEDAQRTIAAAKNAEGPFAFDSLREQEEYHRGMVAHTVLRGDPLEFSRSFALRVALIRDARQTITERVAARGPVRPV